MLNIDTVFPMKVDWLKDNIELIHYFGLGFIQLKINKEYRLHFYTPELPPIVPKEDVHNHRYDFTSMILKGIFTQEIYGIVSNENTHITREESCNPDVKCESTGIPCGIKLISRQTYYPGSKYWIDHDAFHRVVNEGECITLLRRTDYKKKSANVIREKNENCVCPFSQKIEEGKLWHIVEGMLNV